MDRELIHRGFPPLCGENPRILILGTFPSPMSREKGEYYGNPRNQFWRVIYNVFNSREADDDYGRKQAFLRGNGVAVWDVIEQCKSDSALDSTIRDPVYNASLPSFIEEHGISRVFFNGGNAYFFYKKGIGYIEKNVLPSTSPAYAAMRFEEKLKLWREKLL